MGRSHHLRRAREGEAEALHGDWQPNGVRLVDLIKIPLTGQEHKLRDFSTRPTAEINGE